MAKRKRISEISMTIDAITQAEIERAEKNLQLLKKIVGKEIYLEPAAKKVPMVIGEDMTQYKCAVIEKTNGKDQLLYICKDSSFDSGSAAKHTQQALNKAIVIAQMLGNVRI
jgi:hypothetical protein